MCVRFCMLIIKQTFTYCKRAQLTYCNLNVTGGQRRLLSCDDTMHLHCNFLPALFTPRLRDSRTASGAHTCRQTVDSENTATTKRSLMGDSSLNLPAGRPLQSSTTVNFKKISSTACSRGSHPHFFCGFQF
jgi:hypothetical protein